MSDEQSALRAAHAVPPFIACAPHWPSCTASRQVLTHTEKAWASITFAGTRHSLAILFAGDEAVEAGEEFVAALPDHEFAIPGQLVADAGVVEVEHRLAPEPRLVVRCELLLLEEN